MRLTTNKPQTRINFSYLKDCFLPANYTKDRRNRGPEIVADDLINANSLVTTKYFQ
jgi:hypothetical protein